VNWKIKKLFIVCVTVSNQVWIRSPRSQWRIALQLLLHHTDAASCGSGSTTLSLYFTVNGLLGGPYMYSYCVCSATFLISILVKIPKLQFNWTDQFLFFPPTFPPLTLFCHQQNII
jgi:hypothetical protein